MRYYFIIASMVIEIVLGSNIRRIRTEKNMSQKELAAKLDCSVKHLSAIENGRACPSLLFVEKASSILKVSFSSLFYSEDELYGSPSVYAKMDKVIEEIAGERVSHYKALIRK